MTPFINKCQNLNHLDKAEKILRNVLKYALVSESHCFTQFRR